MNTQKIKQNKKSTRIKGNYIPNKINQNQLARMESNYIPKKYTKVNTTKMKDNYILINIPKLIKTKGNCIPNINHTKNQSE